MQLALRISGTKVRQAGFSPLVNIGLIPEEIGENMDRSFSFLDSPAYVLRHGDNYVSYLLVDRKVRSFDAEANGVLSIALIISNDACLAEGRSPFTLLREVYDAFRGRFMTPLADGRYSYINQEIADDVFQEILQKYPLESRQGPYVKMQDLSQGSFGIMQVPDQTLEDFFRDTQYNEFRRYSEIQIGQTCSSSLGLDNLDIPRLPEFEVVLNGRRTGRFLKYPQEIYEAAIPDDGLVEYQRTSFMLDELLSSPEGMLERDGATIRLDREKAQILCDLQKRDVMYSVRVMIDTTSEKVKEIVMDSAKAGDFILKFGPEDLTSQLFQPTPVSMSVSSCSRNSPEIKTVNKSPLYSFRADKELRRGTKELIIVVRAVRRPSETPYFQGGGGNKPSVPQQERTVDPYGQDRPTYASRPSEKEERGFFALKPLVALGIGFLLGALVMWGLSALLGFKRIPSDQTMIEEKVLKAKNDSIDQLKKTYNARIQELQNENAGLNQQLEQLRQEKPGNRRGGSGNAGSSGPVVAPTGGNNPGQTPTTTVSDEDLNNILAAVNAGKKRADVENMPGYRSVKYDRRQAIGWILDTKNCCKPRNGKFQGNSNYSHSNQKAQKIRELTANYKNSPWTWERIDEYYGKVVDILKSAN